MSRKPRPPLFNNLEPLEVDELRQAIAEWHAEDDGTDDYPDLADVLAVRFGVTAEQAAIKALREILRVATHRKTPYVMADWLIETCRAALGERPEAVESK